MDVYFLMWPLLFTHISIQDDFSFFTEYHKLQVHFSCMNVTGSKVHTLFNCCIFTNVISDFYIRSRELQRVLPLVVTDRTSVKIIII